MTVAQLRSAITQIVQSIKKNGDLDSLKSYVDPDGIMTDDEAFKQCVEDFSSQEVLDFVQNNYLTMPLGFPAEALGLSNMDYYILGSDHKASRPDGTMHYLFVDQYCITTYGALFRSKVLEVSNDQLRYDSTIILQIELYDSVNSDWYFILDSLTASKESPLNGKYDGFLDY